MKISLVVTVAVLAVAQASNPLGYYGHSSMQFPLWELTNKMVQALKEVVQNSSLTDQVHTLMQDSKSQLEPLVTQLEPLVIQLKIVANDINVQTQSHIIDFQRQMGAIIQQLTDLARATDN